MMRKKKYFLSICRLFLLLFLLATTLAIQQASAITLRWDWTPNNNWTSGPGGDIAYSLYMMEQGGSGYEYDFPIVTDIDNCWWNIDKYECQGELNSSFTPGVTYNITCVAYVVTDPLQRSAFSEEVQYTAPLPDSDGDGLPDDDEIDVWDSLGIDPYGDIDGDGTDNLNDDDSDDDGLTDAEEISTYGTNPGHTDSDLDGLEDYAEIFTYGSNPNLVLTDSDNLTDYDEVITYGTNPNMADSDMDGVDDDDEIAFWVTHGSTWDSDIDGDGIINILDNDADGDGRIDSIDGDPAEPYVVSAQRRKAAAFIVITGY